MVQADTPQKQRGVNHHNPVIPRGITRIVKYTLTRLVVLAAMVVVGVFVSIYILNYGGWIDKIYGSIIDESLGYMAMEMDDVPDDQKPQVLADARQKMEHTFGLDKPFMLRMINWTYRSLTFNWESVNMDGIIVPFPSSDMSSLIKERIPHTLALAGASNVLIFFAALFGALYLSRHYNSLTDRLAITLSPISSIPNWIFGIILSIIFAHELGWLPFGGIHGDTPPQYQWQYVFVYLRHMVLPVTAIFLSTFFQSLYSWRTFFLLHSQEDFVELARAKGLPDRLIERRYILRTNLPITITSFALIMLGFWTAIMPLEKFFNWPGIGELFLKAVTLNQRYTTIYLMVLFAYFLAISVFLLDIIYALVDPRIKIDSGVEQESNRLSVFHKLRWFFTKKNNPPRPAARLSSQSKVSVPSLTKRAALRKRKTVSLRPLLRQLRRYPSAVIGVCIILVLLGISAYALITIPYDEAVRLWRADGQLWLHNPENAAPIWYNLFRKDDLPANIVLSTREQPESRVVKPQENNLIQYNISLNFDYPYKYFPKDLVLFIDTDYGEKKPFVEVVIIEPSGKVIKLMSEAITSSHTYTLSLDEKIPKKTGREGDRWTNVEMLFSPDNAASPFPENGHYEVKVTGFTFEPNSDLNAELVVYGQVAGWAGTDHNRRDLMVPLLWGAPIALAFGIGGALLTTLATMIFAAIGVWKGGWVDGLIQRLTEVSMMIPALPLAITAYYAYGKSIWVILGIIILAGVFGSAIKNYRAVFLQLKEQPYIDAARVYGASDFRIITRYLLPRILPVIVPQLVTMVPGYIFLEATLAYMGVSDISLPTWGKMINEAITISILRGTYYWFLEPISLLMITGLAFAMLGSALDRMLNPRLREE